MEIGKGIISLSNLTGYLSSHVNANKSLGTTSGFVPRRRTSRHNQQKNAEKGFERYVRYGLSLIADLGTYYNGASLEGKQKIIGSICSENFIYEKREYRTSNLNPAIALFCGNSGENRTKEKALNHENSVPVLNGCPTRTRTSTNRTKICGAAITPSGSLKKEPEGPHPKSVPKIRKES